MAVYEANIRSLANFISNTKIGIMPDKVSSTEGYRQTGSLNRYKISVHKISCDKIYVVNDCFIDIDGNIVVTSYIPTIRYLLVTNELSQYYNNEHLSFEYRINSKVLKYEILKDIELKSYDDFENCIDCLIEYIIKNIEKSINKFENGSWKIDNIVCDILWRIDKIQRE